MSCIDGHWYEKTDNISTISYDVYSVIHACLKCGEEIEEIIEDV